MLKQCVNWMIIRVNGFNKNTSLFSGLDFHCIKNKIINKKKNKLSFSQEIEMPFLVLRKEILKIWIFSKDSLVISSKTSFLQQFQFCQVCQGSDGHNTFLFLPLSGKSRNSFKVKPKSELSYEASLHFLSLSECPVLLFLQHHIQQQKPLGVSFCFCSWL